MNELLWMSGIAVLLILVGVWLFRRSLRGPRIGETPHCPKCNYILFQTHDGVCPECGNTYNSKTIQYGERSSASIYFYLLSLVPLSVALVIVLLVGDETIRQIPWSHYKTLSKLVAEMDSSDYNRAISAWSEIERRMAAGPTSPSHRAIIVDRAFREQEKPASASIEHALIDFLGDCFRDGKLTPTETKRFFDNALRANLRVRQLVCTGDRIPFSICDIGHAPRNDWWIQTRVMQIKLGNTIIQPDQVDPIGRPRLEGPDGWSVEGNLPAMPAGHYDCEVLLEVKFFLTFDILATPAFSTVIQLNDHLEVRSDESIVHPVDIYSANDLTPLLEADFSGNPADALYIRTHSIPVDLACKVYALQNGSELFLGAVSLRGGILDSVVIYGSENMTSLVFPTDLILRSDRTITAKTLDQTSYWNGEMRLPKIQTQISSRLGRRSKVKHHATPY